MLSPIVSLPVNLSRSLQHEPVASGEEKAAKRPAVVVEIRPIGNVGKDAEFAVQNQMNVRKTGNVDRSEIKKLSHIDKNKVA